METVFLILLGDTFEKAHLGEGQRVDDGSECDSGEYFYQGCLLRC